MHHPQAHQRNAKRTWHAMSDDCITSSEECNVDNRLSPKRNLMKSYDISNNELAYVVTPTCGTACLAKGLHDTIIDSTATCHVINNDHYAQPCYNFRPARSNDGLVYQLIDFL